MKDNKCPQCKIGYIYCSWIEGMSMWEENCSDCGYRKLRSNKRTTVRDIAFECRRRKNYLLKRLKKYFSLS